MLLELHAIEKYALPENWSSYRYECFPKTCGETLYYQLTGMVAPPKTKGPNKGRPNWKNGDRNTKFVCIIPVSEHEQWLKTWELKTGKCSGCEGTGKALAQWSVIKGSEYRECSKCKGTGLKNEQPLRNPKP